MQGVLGGLERVCGGVEGVCGGVRECAVGCGPHPGPAHADRDLVHVQRVEQRSAGAV